MIKDIYPSTISRMLRSVYCLLVLCVFILSACQSNIIITTESPTIVPSPSVIAPNQSTALANPGPVDIAVNYIKKWGEIMVDGNGMTLYISTNDSPDKSNCDTRCLEMWQPLLARDNLKLGQGVDPSMIGSGILPDGSKVVTYGHMPLYRFRKDVKPGDIQGQGSYNSWFMINPQGEAQEGEEG